MSPRFLKCGLVALLVFEPCPQERKRIDVLYLTTGDQSRSDFRSDLFLNLGFKYLPLEAKREAMVPLKNSIF